MKVQYDGNLGVRRNNPWPVDPEEGAGCGVERHVFGNSHGSVGGGGFIDGGYEVGQATAGERAVWVILFSPEKPTKPSAWYVLGLFLLVF